MISAIKRRLRSWYRNLPRKEDSDSIHWARYLKRLVIKLALWFFGLSIGFTLLYRFMPVPFTPLMITRLPEQAWASDRSMRMSKDWVSLDDITPEMQLAVVCAEDQQFLEHEGFDFKAIKNAYRYNKTHKKKRGASTISQQTAKNVFLWETRSVLRKGLEVYFTFLIEVLWDKERIMEVYLNVIEFGDGIYGVEAAAQHYYGKTAKTLNRAEAAMLSTVLPSPLHRNPLSPTSDMLEKKRNVMRSMRSWGGVLDFEDPNTPKNK